jgi:hypothetical protein
VDTISEADFFAAEFAGKKATFPRRLILVSTIIER